MTMNEKFRAGFLAFVIIAPVFCTICVLGPVVITSFFAGIVAWFGGSDVIVVAGLVFLMIIGILAIGSKHWVNRGLIKPAGR